MGKGAHRTRNSTSGDFAACRNQPLAATLKFSVKTGKFQTKRSWFSMNAMATANGGGAFMFMRAFIKTRKQAIKPGQHQVSGPNQLNR